MPTDRSGSLDERLRRLEGPVAHVARDLVQRIRALTVDVTALEREIGQLVAPPAPTSLALIRCGGLTAAEIVARNRQLNAALHRIAVTQIRGHQPPEDHLQRRLGSGLT